MVKVLQQDTWIDDRKFLKSCVRARAEQGNINQLAYGTWTADFMLRQNESRAFLGKYSNDPHVPWRHKRREMMAIAGIIPVAKCLAKIKQRSDVSCILYGTVSPEVVGSIPAKLTKPRTQIYMDLSYIDPKARVIN